MAVTKIHGIKTTVDKAIEYICNPDKTDEKIYISSFACAPETASLDFKYTLDHATEQNFKQHKTSKAEIAELELIRQNMEKYLDITSPEVPKALYPTPPEI